MKQLERSEIATLIQAVPKAELHLHIEGLASVDSIWTLKQKNTLEFSGIESKEDLVRRFQVQSLDEFIDFFINIIQNCFQEESDLSYLITDTERYLLENGIEYAELFFAPSKFVRNGFSYAHMAEILDEGAKHLKKTHGIEVKYLIDVSRSFGKENAMRNLNLILSNPKPSIIGIGLGGAESKGPAAEYSEVFSKAKAAGLHLVAHAGEDVGPESIQSAIDNLYIERIGHGISAIEDEFLRKQLKEKQIPLEVCPTSNLFTRKYASSYENHPIKTFFQEGLYVTLNTDDPTIFGSELVDEYMHLYDHDIFTVEELIQLLKNGIYASFQERSDQDALWHKAKQVLEQYS